MKKLIYFLIYSTISFSFIWQPHEKLNEYMPYLKPADIVVFKPFPHKLASSFGHSIIYVGYDKFAEFFDYRAGFREMPIEYYDKFYLRDFVILRSKEITDEKSEKIIKTFYNDLFYKKYFFLAIPDIIATGTYCSHSITYAYNRAFDKQMFYSSKPYVYPVDFLYSGENFYQILLP